MWIDCVLQSTNLWRKLRAEPEGDLRSQRDGAVVVYGNKLLFCQSSALESHMIEKGFKGYAHGGMVEDAPAMRWLGSVSRSL